MRERSLPSLAMALAIRDEERFLSANLAYHHALGVSRVYVFLDRCTDASQQIAQAFPWVRTIDDDVRSDDRSLPTYLNRCARAALKLARAEGFDWLMGVGADEFAFGDRRSGRIRQRLLGRHARTTAIGSLPRMLA